MRRDRQAGPPASKAGRSPQRQRQNRMAARKSSTRHRLRERCGTDSLPARGVKTVSGPVAGRGKRRRVRRGDLKRNLLVPNRGAGRGMAARKLPRRGGLAIETTPTAPADRVRPAPVRPAGRGLKPGPIEWRKDQPWLSTCGKWVRIGTFSGGLLVLPNPNRRQK